MIKFVNALAMLVAVALGFALMIASENTATDLEHLERLQSDLARERGRISALEVEIAAQEDRENLRRLARVYLGFEPVEREQRIALSELPRVAGAQEVGAQPDVLGAVRVSLEDAP